MMSVASRMTISDEMVALADSIEGGDNTLQTLEELMECRDLASLTVDMTPSNISLSSILFHVVGDSDVKLRLQLALLCGVRRVWRQHVIDGSQQIPYRLLEIAGFGGFILEPSSLQKVMPIPRGDVYEFLMRVEGDTSRNTLLTGKWFQYVVTLRNHLPLSGIDDICRSVLDHPRVTVSESIVTACMDANMPVDVFSGDTTRRALLKCTTSSRRRLRCGSRAETSRSAIIATWISSWVNESAHAAVLVRDVIFNEILLRTDAETLNFELIGGIVSKTQTRLPYIPLDEEDLSRVPVKVRESSKTWTVVVERIRRLPPSEERVAHPIWAVRRHY
jgi:hypothetical protein